MVAIILIFTSAVILPATLMWWLFRENGSSIRVTAAIAGGQFLATPAMFYIAWQEATPSDPDPWTALVTVAAIALLVAALVAWALERTARDETS